MGSVSWTIYAKYMVKIFLFLSLLWLVRTSKTIKGDKRTRALYMIRGVDQLILAFILVHQNLVAPYVPFFFFFLDKTSDNFYLNGNTTCFNSMGLHSFDEIELT